MDAGARIIVVEDEPLTRVSIMRFLESEGHAVRQASDVAACRAALRAQPADIVILDLGLPGPDGLVLARELRADPTVDVIVITMREKPEDRIAALDCGADDYLVKPVHFGELAARIRAALRRRRLTQPKRIRFGACALDLDRRTLISGNGAPIALTRGEFEVLASLVDARGKIVARETLSRAMHRQREPGADLRSVDALVSRLRRKLSAEGKDIITTAPGFGYRLNAPVTEE